MDDAAILTKLDELMVAIGGYGDPRRAAAEWKQVFKLLQKASLPADRIAGIVGMRDLGRLGEVVGQLRSPTGTADSLADVADAKTCRAALLAFRRRSALTRLDEESQISSRSPLSKGENLQAAAIVPPDEWPQAVWDELVRQGRLRCIGHGFYELIRQPQ